MKFNKWTLVLAALGTVSLTSAAHADEAKITPLQTTLANTTISGYVDTAAQYNTGNQAADSGIPAGTTPGKIDNFSLNNVTISIDHPMDSTAWAAGYHVDFNLGTDAVGWGTGGNTGVGNAGTAVRQAYVALNTPVGNGINWKMGVQDDIIGYEGNTDGANPNYTRSIGYSIEPTTLLGLIGSYQICNAIGVQAGVANATSPGGGQLSNKTLAAAVALTAPDSWGFLKGATANLGLLVNPFKQGQYNYYAGITVPTPISALKFGSSFDLVSINDQDGVFNSKNDSGWVLGVYGSYQATDKLSFNLRGEYFDLTGATDPYGFETNGKGEEITATVDYNLWANVLTRAEIRWDHSDTGTPFGFDSTVTTPGTPYSNSFLLALNVIYTF